MPTVDDNTIKPKREGYEYKENDRIHSLHEQQVDFAGMKVDRMFFQQFEEKVKTDDEIKQLMEAKKSKSLKAALSMEIFSSSPRSFLNLCSNL